MINELLPKDARRRTQLILTGIILLTLPCYCAGCFALGLRPVQRDGASTATQIAAVTRIPVFTITFTSAPPTPTLFTPGPPTPTLTPTSTEFAPPSRTPSLTPSSTSTLEATPTSTDTATPLPTATATLVPFAVSINFQTDSAEVPPGYLPDSGAVYGDRGNGYSYGWNEDNTGNTRDRDSSRSPDQRYDTLTHLQQDGTFIWEIAAPAGVYLVHAVSGDPNHTDSIFQVDVEGVIVVNGIPIREARWLEGTTQVSVTDGRMTVSSGPDASNNKINFIEITQIQ
jgi:hypothetical protein